MPLRIPVWLHLCLVLLLSSCQFEDVTLENVKDFKIEKVSSKGMEGTIFLELNNPNMFPITVKSAEFEIFNGNIRLGDAQLKEGFKIKGKSTEVYPVSLYGNMSNLMAGGLAGLAGLLSGKNPIIQIKGELKAGNLFVTRKIPVEIETELPIREVMGG